jgi:hypothetical protein
VPAPPRRLGVDYFTVGLGAVVGTILRFATVAIWPDPVHVLASTLLAGGLSALVIGYLSTGHRGSSLRSGLLGVAGSTASLGMLAMFAVASSPLLCACYVVFCPIFAIAGVTAGVVAGVAANGKAKSVVDES